MKYRPYSREQIRTRFRVWAVQRRRALLNVVLAALVLIIIETILILVLMPAGPLRWYALGIVHAAMPGVVAWLFYSMFLALDGSAIHHLRGAWGEENTRNELRRAERKRSIWGWVDSVGLQAGDIDHLVVSRSGGIIAIDSKWRNRADAHDQESMVRSARKVALRANALVQTLTRRERGAHRADGSPVTVTPVVVLWGASQADLPDNARIEGIEFVAGKRLVHWLATRSGHDVDKRSGHELIRLIEGFRESARVGAQQRSSKTQTTTAAAD
ncbi:nuclease-related domain-containing protein [Aeromicrobium sp. CF3.5]|uniref:nuclease-related domain-containing protein n=1 Tax=Aeromicrobium sp. CF3.5 TaxID=3373078 RepID=UPI003EE4269D